MVSIPGFPGDSMVKNPPANAGDTGSIPGWGRSPEQGNGHPLQYYHLENPMNRRAGQAAVHGLAESQTWLSMHTRKMSIPYSLVPFKVTANGCASEHTTWAGTKTNMTNAVLCPHPQHHPRPPHPKGKTSISYDNFSLSRACVALLRNLLGLVSEGKRRRTFAVWEQSLNLGRVEWLCIAEGEEFGVLWRRERK